MLALPTGREASAVVVSSVDSVIARNTHSAQHLIGYTRNSLLEEISS